MFWERFARLSDEQLLQAAKSWAADERRRTTDILGILIVMDDRDLPTRIGHPGLFRFCTEDLRFTEAVAFWRIRAARAAKKYPEIAEKLESGQLNITTVTILSAYLTDENVGELVTRAAGKTRKEVETMIASLSPTGPRRDVVTRCGPAIVAKAQWPPPQPVAAAEQKMLDVVEALDAERRRLHFDVGPDTAQLLERAREILRHKFPFASLEDIVREALNVLLDHKDLARNLENGRDVKPAEPKPGEPPSRAIPMWVRREVWKRDDGKCAFVSDDGKLCGEKSWLEFDHRIPFAKGGRSDDPANVRLLCRAHNQLEARRVFGSSGSA